MAFTIDNLQSWPVVLVALLVALLVYVLWSRLLGRRERVAKEILEDMAALGDVVPDTLYPRIDLDRCIGSGACVRACPEKQILEVVEGQARLLNPLACVGHGACVAACPVDAIKLVFGSEERGVELPKVDAHFETVRAGVYVIGELSGMGLIRNAVRQGRQAADHVAQSSRRGTGDAYDAVVVGAGPAGISATLRLMETGLRVALLERDAVGSTILHFPRAKVVMTGALEFAIVGTVKRRTMSKEELVQLWESIVDKAKVPVHTGVLVESVAEGPRGMWQLSTSQGSIHAANVLLALGRRGSPRKLGVPGEDLPKVAYRLIEPDPFAGKHVLVVGGGNSAVECAIALADFGRCASVTISYRRNTFARCRADNRRRIDEAISTGKVIALMPSDVVQIEEGAVTLRAEGATERVANDAVIVQVGGTAPAELLKQFGIDVVTKYGEA